jgi:hypothetical protein
MKLSRHANLHPLHVNRLQRYDNMFPRHCYCFVDLHKYIYINILRVSVDMVGLSQDMVTYSPGMIMPHCKTFTMHRETFSITLDTISLA